MNNEVINKELLAISIRQKIIQNEKAILVLEDDINELERELIKMKLEENNNKEVDETIENSKSDDTIY